MVQPVSGQSKLHNHNQGLYVRVKMQHDIPNGRGETASNRGENGPWNPPERMADARPAELDSEQERLPDGGYGWVIVASCFTLNCFTWGVTSSYGVYLSHYLSSELFPGATSMDYGLIGGFNFAFAMIFAPLATYTAHRFGKRGAMLAGAVVQSAGLISASFASEVRHLYVTQGALVGAGIGLVFVPSLPVLSQWFSEKRSVANGISSAGSGVGGVVFSWGTGAMIRSLGLSWALRATGLATLVANAAATLLIRDQRRQARPNKLVLDVQLLRKYEVSLLLLWAFVSMFGYITLLFSLADFSRSIGLSSAQATDVTGVLNLGTAVGRPLIGIASDRFRRIDTAGMLTLLCGIICFAMWLPATTFASTVAFAFICGAILGVFWMGRYVRK
ncbi:major facilitator superfamily transporter [Colletotrichum graminicola M1.001]|uniref:Major facilitator superfamily transporter n=1 Tax=Colletotrichum graminicola (strain M1.001 / M2 / FGSC 10212) TaxID=645133 RepID=E3QFH0_COLGM|nr:major facilitator superfamily transporter [Colletotrichum graminicola M1.001]EFQ29608.1 major facilitator superfamily transporter [Colletotrichum graminicola M1.001]